MLPFLRSLGSAISLTFVGVAVAMPVVIAELELSGHSLIDEELVIGDSEELETAVVEELD